ncbi:hypothetical protein H8E07_00300, partial [bacterium]|nr:hypothetical protein [bacterium]
AGWVWRLYALSTGRLYGTIIGTGLDLTGESNILGVMNTVAGIAAWGAMIFWKRRRLAILMIVSEALWLMITGSKGSILYVLITYLMLTTGGRARAVTGRTVAVACVGFVLFAAGFVIVHSYRVAAETQINRRGFASFNPIEAVTEMKITGEEFQHVGLAISKRLNLARRLSLILDTPESEQEPPWLGRTYLMSVMWAVPRAVWPDKPSMSLGRWYATKYYGWGKRIKGEAGPTIWGEAYLNFRGTGMMVIPALWLIFLQFVYIFSWRIGPWGLLFLAKIYLVAMNSLASNVSMVVATMGQATLIVLLLYLLTRVVGVCRVRLREVRA